MFLLHIVVTVQAPSSWLTGLTLWVVSVLVGGSFSYWTGGAKNPDGLALDLLLAGAGAGGGALVAVPLGSDPLASIYRVPLLWSMVGAVGILLLGRDLQSSRRRTPMVAGSEDRAGELVGGFSYVIPRLTGWPSATGLLDVPDAAGRPIKLTNAAVYYQIPVGPFRIARAVPLLPGLSDRDQALAFALVSHVLDAAKISAHGRALVFTEFSVQPFLDEVAAIVQPLVAQRRNAFRVDAAADVGTICTDRFTARQCLLDLLADAASVVEYATIVLHVERSDSSGGGYVRFIVTASDAGVAAISLSPWSCAGGAEVWCERHPGGNREPFSTQELCHRLGGEISVAHTPDHQVIIAICLPAFVNQVDTAA